MPSGKRWATSLRRLHQKIKALLEKRDTLQQQIDEWHLARKDEPLDGEAYSAFLTDIGYLLPEGRDFTVITEDVDTEISLISGPQSWFVPTDNARYALNARERALGKPLRCTLRHRCH